MYSVSNCHNIAKHIKLCLGWLWLNVASTGNARCFKKRFAMVFQMCVAIITKTFTLKGVQTIHR
jgi:hypothetical protein